MEKRKRGASAASAEGKRKPGPWKRCRQNEAADEKKRNRKRIKKRQDLRNKVFLIENNSARILFCREAPATPCIRMLPGIRYGCCPWAVTVCAGKLCRIDAREHFYKKKPSKAQALAKTFQKSGCRRGGSLAGSGGVSVQEREKTGRNLSECPASDRAKREKASLRAKIAAKLEELPARILAPSGKYEWEDLRRRGEDPVGRNHEAGDRTAL